MEAVAFKTPGPITRKDALLDITFTYCFNFCLSFDSSV